MTDWVRGQGVPGEDMIRPEDIAEIVRCLLRLSPAAIVPEVMIVRPQELARGAGSARLAAATSSCFALFGRLPALGIASAQLPQRGLDRLAVAVPAPERDQPGRAVRCACRRSPGARSARRRGAACRAAVTSARISSSRQMLASICAVSVRTSRSLALRARRPAPVKRSQARAKLRKSVRPPQRCAASIGQTPPLRSL